MHRLDEGVQLGFSAASTGLGSGSCRAGFASKEYVILEQLNLTTISAAPDLQQSSTFTNLEVGVSALDSSDGGPSKTILPPPAPPTGPNSISQSANFIKSG